MNDQRTPFGVALRRAVMGRANRSAFLGLFVLALLVVAFYVDAADGWLLGAVRNLAAQLGIGRPGDLLFKLLGILFLSSLLLLPVLLMRRFAGLLDIAKAAVSDPVLRLLERLDSPLSQNEAADSLVQLGRGIVPSLCDELRAGRRVGPLARILERIGDPAAGPALVQRLETHPIGVSGHWDQYWVIHALESMKVKEATPKLVERFLAFQEHHWFHGDNKDVILIISALRTLAAR